MKKLLFSILCILGFIGVISAKTEIEYDWGMFYDNYVFDAKIYNNELVMATSKKYWRTNVSYDKYNDVGENYFSIKLDDSETVYFFQDMIISIKYVNRVPYKIVYDDNFSVISEVELVGWNSSETDEYGETDDYYYIGYNIFDKTTGLLVDLNELISSHELFELFLEKEENDNAAADLLYLDMIKDLIPGTFYALDYYVWLQDFDDRDVNDYFYNGADGYAISFYDYDTDQVGVEFYDKDFNVTKTLLFDSYVEPYILFKDNYLYIFEVKHKEIMNNDELEQGYYYSVTEYDFEFNKRTEFDLSLIQNNNSINLKAQSGRFIYDVLATADGFVFLTDIYRVNSIDDESMQRSYFALQKYSFVYSVDAQENENGSIEVDKGSSKTGEMIKYNVQPKDGYKLEKVIVTDDSGNTIEIKDSSFVMPSSNVTIEAVFVVDNPNTGVFLKVGIACIITFVCYFFIILKNMKVKQYE